jgi:AraC-like DNA-binding protein
MNASDDAAMVALAEEYLAAAQPDRDPVAESVVAADLGYADQAHLTREFSAMIGIPPARYAHA